MKGNNKVNNNNISVFDSITGYKMGFDASGDMVLVKEGITYKLADNEVILKNMVKEEN
mgnify:CR=1 FL=1